MASITFTIKYGKNEGLSISPSELISQYLFGLELCTRSGQTISDETIFQKILTAQRRLEQYLMIKFNKQTLEESRDFMRDDYYQWGFMTVGYPVKNILGLTGFISTTKQTEFPIDWVSNNKTTQEDLIFRTIHIVPAGNSSPQTNSVIYVGIAPNLGYSGIMNIPNYWTVKYITGFDNIPPDLREAASKMAAIEILAIIGDLVLHPGVASESLSYDGLSQNISTTKSGQTSAYSARIKQYSDDLTRQIRALRDYYRGLTFTSM